MQRIPSDQFISIAEYGGLKVASCLQATSRLYQNVISRNIVIDMAIVQMQGPGNCFASHHAAAVGNVDVADQFLQRKADPNRVAWNTLGEAITPLYMAVKRCHTEVVRRLLTARADPDGIVIYTRSGNRSASESPLHFAAACGNESIISFLLAANADPAPSGRDLAPPLIDATVYGHKEVVQKLLEANAGVDDTGGERCSFKTALHWSAQEGHEQIATNFLQARADPHAFAEDEEDGIPWQIAEKAGHQRLSAALLQAALAADGEF